MSVSIVVNYYNNQRALEVLLENFRKLTKVKKDFFELVLVDDHSHEPTDLKIFDGVPAVRVFRLVDDVRWNMPGARNVGALEARKRQILFSDVDHILDPDELDAFFQDSETMPLATRLTPGRKRLAEKAGSEPLKPNINVFLIHRQDFFRAGGYEEMFSGHYSQEDKYFRYCCRWNGMKDEPANFKVTAVGGATRTLDRDKTRNEAVVEALVGVHSWKPRKAFQFPYIQLV